MNLRRFFPAALLLAVVTTLTLALAAEAISRTDHDGVGAASSRYCADPGHCGGNMMLSVSRAEASATPFARTWARAWNRSAAGHKLAQQIVTAGCNYLATERYYLCAVRVRADAPTSPGPSCGLIVIKPETQPNPSDQIENGLETACRILSAYPRQTVT
jgi:hypothetical protein